MFETFAAAVVRRLSLGCALIALAVTLFAVSAPASASGQCQEICAKYAADRYDISFFGKEAQRYQNKIRTAKNEADKAKYVKLMEKAQDQKAAAQKRMKRSMQDCHQAIDKASPTPKKVTTKTCEDCQKQAKAYDDAKFEHDRAAARLKTAKSCTDDEHTLERYEFGRKSSEGSLKQASQKLDACEKKYCVGGTKN